MLGRNTRQAHPGLGTTYAVIKTVMLKETVDGEFTATADVAQVAQMFAAFTTNALTGQPRVVSHGWLRVYPAQAH